MQKAARGGLKGVRMWLVMLALKPYLAFLFFAILVVPLKVLFVKKFPEGRVKRLLLRRIS
jgi:hypothetical protein